jgi:hypothetical protein
MFALVPPSESGKSEFTLHVPDEILGTPVEAEVSKFVPPFEGPTVPVIPVSTSTCAQAGLFDVPVFER